VLDVEQVIKDFVATRKEAQMKENIPFFYLWEGRQK
jgi:hypothetical protein